MRRRLGIAAVLVAVVAVIEILILIAAVRYLGGAWTLLLIVATSLAGAFALRREGIMAWRRFRAGQAAGRAPGDEVTRGLAGLTGGFLLLLPGFLTDLVGLLMLSPPGRAAVGAGMRRAAETRLSSPVAGDLFGPRRVRVRTGRPERTPPPPPRPDGDRPVIEGEIVNGP